MVEHERTEEEVAYEVYDIATTLLWDVQERITNFHSSGLAVPPSLLLEYQNRRRAADAAWQRYRSLANEAMAVELAELPLKLQRQ